MTFKAVRECFRHLNALVREGAFAGGKRKGGIGKEEIKERAWSCPETKKNNYERGKPHRKKLFALCRNEKVIASPSDFSWEKKAR